MGAGELAMMRCGQDVMLWSYSKTSPNYSLFSAWTGAGASSLFISAWTGAGAGAAAAAAPCCMAYALLTTSASLSLYSRASWHVAHAEQHVYALANERSA